MQKAYYLSTHLARSMTPKDLYKYMRACVHVCVRALVLCAKTRESV